MGGGSYSMTDRSVRCSSMGYDTKSTQEIFTQKSINSSMNPKGIKVREARDSKEHPNSLGILLALDVTGSMGSVPHHLVKEGLPDIMDSIIKSGIPDPQLLFVGIGDHECDDFPLQVGQFESSDELLDKWLTDIYLEGGGGGNGGESYLLAWYFASKHTSMDSFEKRKQKGFLFTIGDEPVLKSVPKGALKGIMGDGEYQSLDATVLIDMARETYNVFHIHIKETSAGSYQSTIDGWKQLLGKNLIVAERHGDVSKIIADTIKSNVGVVESNPQSETTEEEIIL